MNKKLIINKKSLKDETVAKLDRLSEEINRSRNELINILLDFAIKKQRSKIKKIAPDSVLKSDDIFICANKPQRLSVLLCHCHYDVNSLFEFMK